MSVDRDDVDAALGEHRAEVVFHLAAQTQVGVANEDPVGTFEHNILGTWTVLEACRAGAVRGERRRRLLGQGVRRPRRRGLRRDRSARGAASVRRLEDVRGRARTDVCRELRLAGRGHAAAGTCTAEAISSGSESSRARSARCSGRSGPSSARTGGSFATISTSRTRPTAWPGSRRRSPSGRNSRGEAFNFAAETRLSVLELVDRIRVLLDAELEPEVLDEAVNEIREQRVDAGKARRELGWVPRHSLDAGLAEVDRVVPAVPGRISGEVTGAATAVCLACRQRTLVPIMSYGDQPLANALLREADLGRDRTALSAGARLLRVVRAAADHRVGRPRAPLRRVRVLLVLLDDDARARGDARRAAHPRARARRATASRSRSRATTAISSSTTFSAGVPVLGIDPARNVVEVAAANGRRDDVRFLRRGPRARAGRRRPARVGAPRQQRPRSRAGRERRRRGDCASCSPTTASR